MAEGRSSSHTRATGSSHSTPHLDSSSVQSRSPPASPRLSSARNSIRRKPAPSVQGDGDAHSTREHGGEGEETLRELGVDTARSPAMRRGNSAGSGSDYGYSMPPSPASASAYAFPPQPRRTGSASSVPHISAIPTYAYNSNTPGGMTAATRSPHPSTSRETLESTSRPPRRTTRASQHSQRESVAQENGSGSAPRGVIGKSKPKEVVRIERDYSEGELCQFWSGWIWELEGRISPTDFQNTMNEVNTVLASAHDPYKSCFDNCCAVLTLYISPRVLGSHYDREMVKFDRVLERANREVFNPAGLNILHPRRNAFLFLEVEYY